MYVTFICFADPVFTRGDKFRVLHISSSKFRDESAARVSDLGHGASRPVWLPQNRFQLQWSDGVWQCVQHGARRLSGRHAGTSLFVVTFPSTARLTWWLFCCMPTCMSATANGFVRRRTWNFASCLRCRSTTCLCCLQDICSALASMSTETIENLHVLTTEDGTAQVNCELRTVVEWYEVSPRHEVTLVKNLSSSLWFSPFWHILAQKN